MPPARPRVADDVRSQTSLTNSKDRVANGTSSTKTKKQAGISANGVSSGPKTGAPTPTSNTAESASTSAFAVGSTATAHGGITTSSTETPHVDWSSLPISALHAYRSAYRLQLPASYSKPHAEIIYKSCDLALKAPSQCLARKKAHDLKLYRKRQAQASVARAQSNGVTKSTKSRSKDKKKPKKDAETDSHSVMEEPPSPKSHPSLQDSASVHDNSDHASRQSPSTSSGGPEQPQDESADAAQSIPPTLFQPDPESTVLGSLPVTNLATSIRTHFNAQQVNEAETLARFAYIARQQGSSIIPRVPPLIQRSGPLPLPTSTAEKIAQVAETAYKAAVHAAANGLPMLAAAGAATVPPVPQISEKAKAVAHSNHSRAAPRVLGGNHIEVEGSYGDGHGWIMSTTSSGRQVRVDDGASSTTFRLRFRP